MNILIVGVGLIGGSFTLSLKKEKNLRFGGFDQSKTALIKAEELGIIDEVFESLDDAINWSDVIILAIPVNGIKMILPAILDQLNPNQLVVDFGSTKKSICDAVTEHRNRSQFIAAHPIAGTENSGPEAAFSGLFEGKNLILCDTEKSDTELLRSFE